MGVPYFPFQGEPYQPKMGLKPLEKRQWIEIDEHYRSQLVYKRRLFREHRSTVLQVRKAGEPYCFELWDEIQRHLLAYHGEEFRTSDQGFHGAAGEVFARPATAEEALEQISRWVQEDWCLLEPEPPFRLVAGFVCFPSRWALAEKMDKAPDAVHEFVPDYSSLLAAPVKNFLEKLSADRPMWRLNWTLHDSDELFCPGPHSSGKTFTVSNVLDEAFLRVERQTLCRLPATGAIAFSIRTYVNPLREVIAIPGKKELLRRSVLGLPLETAHYRGMGPFLQELRLALELP